MRDLDARLVAFLQADPSFLSWTYLWAAIMHWLFAIWGGCNFLRVVTRFSCETFGFYVAAVYIQYGIQGRSCFRLLEPLCTT